MQVNDILLHDHAHAHTIEARTINTTTHMTHMTHQEIFAQPNAHVSRLLALLKLEGIRTSATNKREVILDRMEQDDPHAELYSRWFDDIAQQANRAINELNQASEEY